MKERRTLIISSVRRSQYWECSEKPNVCEMAVLPMRGTLGRMAFNMGSGDVSMVMFCSR
mgnify:CR=1 FL=1